MAYFILSTAEIGNTSTVHEPEICKYSPQKHVSSVSPETYLEKFMLYVIECYLHVVVVVVAAAISLITKNLL